jgi:hypothetical protein
VDGEVSIAAIQGTGEQEVEFVAGDGGLDVGVFFGDFLPSGGVGLFFGHFDENLKIINAGIESGQWLNAAFDAVDLVDDFTGGVLAVPETGGGDALFEFF